MTMPTINSEASPIAIAIAVGAIAIALLDNLIERGVLTTENGRDVLAEAQRRLIPFTNNADVTEADRVIGSLFQEMPNHSGYSNLVDLHPIDWDHQYFAIAMRQA
jgi:hypothetical protein